MRKSHASYVRLLQTSCVPVCRPDNHAIGPGNPHARGRDRVQFPRMRRRIGHLVSRLSLLLCVAAAVLWVRSDRDTYDRLSIWYSRHQSLFIESYEVACGIFVRYDHWTWVESADVFPPQERVDFFTNGPKTRVPGSDVWTQSFPHGWGNLTAGIAEAAGEDRSVFIGFTAPYWLAVSAFLCLTLMAALGSVRRHRHGLAACAPLAAMICERRSAAALNVAGLPLRVQCWREAYPVHG